MTLLGPHDDAIVPSRMEQHALIQRLVLTFVWADCSYGANFGMNGNEVMNY